MRGNFHNTEEAESGNAKEGSTDNHGSGCWGSKEKRKNQQEFKPKRIEKKEGWKLSKHRSTKSLTKNPHTVYCGVSEPRDRIFYKV